VFYERHYIRRADIFQACLQGHAPYLNKGVDLVFNAQNSNCLYRLPQSTGFASSGGEGGGGIRLKLTAVYNRKFNNSQILCLAAYPLPSQLAIHMARNTKGEVDWPRNIQIIIWDSSVSIATRYGVDGPGSNPSGIENSVPVQTGPGVHPDSYVMGTGSFPGVKRPGRGADHPPPSSAEVKRKVELQIDSTSGPSWHLLGRTLPLPLHYIYLYTDNLSHTFQVITFTAIYCSVIYLPVYSALALSH